MLRDAIREARKLDVVYSDAAGRRSERTVRPLALLFYIESVVLAAWCELRSDFRHFRADRILACCGLEERFLREAPALARLPADLTFEHAPSSGATGGGWVTRPRLAAAPWRLLASGSRSDS